MDNNEDFIIPTKMARINDRTPESFITLCHLIKDQTIQYGDAWDIVKDLVRANVWMEERPF